jgi:hypothetical protein
MHLLEIRMYGRVRDFLALNSLFDRHALRWYAKNRIFVAAETVVKYVPAVPVKQVQCCAEWDLQCAPSPRQRVRVEFHRSLPRGVE